MSTQILNDRNFAASFINSLSQHGELPAKVSVRELSFLSTLSLRYKKKGITQILLENEQRQLQENDKVQVSFCLEDTFFKFDTLVIGILENHCIIEMPNNIHSSYRRLVKRYAINEGEGFTFSLLDQPLKPVDISTKGMAFTCSKDILSEGQQIKQLKIKTPDQSEFYIDGEVRHCETSSESKFSYGIKFTEDNLALYQELFKYILKKTYPDVVPLEDEGRASILTGFSKYRGDKAVIEGVAQRMYNHTFLGKQMIPTKGIKDMLDSQTILADTVLAHPYLKHYIAYNEADLTLSSMFEEISKAISDKDRMIVQDLGIYEFDVESYDFPDMSYSVIALESPTEFLKFCEDRMPSLEANCFGYNAEDFYLKRLKKEYEELELSVDRGLWAVYNKSELLAYVVAEAYSECVNDTARIYTVAEVAGEPLVSAVALKLRGFYARHGKQKFNVTTQGTGQKIVQMVLLDSEGLSLFRKLLAVSPTRYIKYYPLTYPQKAIWNMEKFYAGTSIGNVAGTIRVKGKQSISYLQDAINVCIAQNPALRLRLTEDNGNPRQYIGEFNYHNIEYLDFSQKSKKELYKWDEEQTRSPFKLLNSDLFYFAVMKLSEDEYGIYIKVHHLVNDGWSIVLIVSRIMKIYSSLRAGQLPRSFEHPSYLEYIISEDERKMSEKFKKNQEFWNNTFSTTPELTYLKQSSSKILSTSAQRKSFIVDDMEGIAVYCKTYKVSIFSLCMAVMSIYLYRTTMKHDMVIGNCRNVYNYNAYKTGSKRRYDILQLC